MDSKSRGFEPKKSHASCNVYFSASSEVDGDEKGLLRQIISDIELAGGKITSNWLDDQITLSPDGVYKQAMEGIRDADILIAELSHPSTGVGQQIAYALSNKVPVIGLHKEGSSAPSKFTVGNNSPLFWVLEYDKANLVASLKRMFDEILKSRFVKFNFITTREIDEYLEKESQSLEVSKSQFLRQLIRSQMK